MRGGLADVLCGMCVRFWLCLAWGCALAMLSGLTQTLLQPILAWADGAPEYTIFNGEYTWSNGVFTQSKSGVVQPGDTVFGSIVYQESTDTYAMTISCQQTGFSVTTVKPASGLEFVNAEIVFEHQPDSCSAFPTSNTCTFSNIYVRRCLCFLAHARANAVCYCVNACLPVCLRSAGDSRACV